MIFSKVGALGLLLTGSMLICADPVTVHNTLNQDVYIRVYQKPGFGSEPWKFLTPVYQVKPSSSFEFERPAISLSEKIYTDRVMVMARSEVLVSKDTLTHDEAKSLPAHLIGWMKGNTFYMSETREGVLKGFGAVEWFLSKPYYALKNTASDAMHAITQYIWARIHNTVTRDNPYHAEEAKVRAVSPIGSPLNDEERAFLEAREKKVLTAIERIVGEPVDPKYMPRIGFTHSGGGYRAMLGTLGTVRGAMKSKLYDAALYTACLSGSTWFYAPWIMSGLPIDTYRDQLYARK